MLSVFLTANYNDGTHKQDDLSLHNVTIVTFTSVIIHSYISNITAQGTDDDLVVSKFCTYTKICTIVELLVEFKIPYLKSLLYLTSFSGDAVIEICRL